jgi:threonine/homoserine/homoserine lactone efflux protein
MTFTAWLAFAAASLVLVIIPGPTVVLVVSYALTQGRRVALAVAAGVATGDLVAMTLSLAGLGALLAASATLFTALKWAGAAYLLYLGIRLWRAKPELAAMEEEGTGRRPAGAIFGHAFVVTALNPKSIAFFVAFVPQFIDHAAPLFRQFVVMEATFVVIAACNALAYALLADQMRMRIRRPGVLRAVNRTGAACLVGMAAVTATAART